MSTRLGVLILLGLVVASCTPAQAIGEGINLILFMPSPGSFKSTPTSKLVCDPVPEGQKVDPTVSCHSVESD